jgi:hypothetical protein
MANKYPYISSSGPIFQGVQQFRKSFPNTVNSETLQKLGIAPKNESYLINILKHLGFLDDELKKTKLAGDTFVLHEQEQFQSAFANAVEAAYEELFTLQGLDTWELDNDRLITFFRSSDQTTDLVGRRQANTFATLASISGKREQATKSSAKPNGKKPTLRAAPKKSIKAVMAPVEQAKEDGNSPTSQGDYSNMNMSNFGLTVRVEINLPAQGDKDTYDRIFRSIRENLIDAKRH